MGNFMLCISYHDEKRKRKILFIVLKNMKDQAQWLMPVILPTWEADIGRIMVQGQPGKIVQETPSPK
jgi:hypothetical protein